jgi:hypothetical protein
VNHNEEKIPEIETGRFPTIKDLHIEPVAFKDGIFSIMREYIFTPIVKDEDREN